jgi:hypothetical protein
MKPEKKKGRQSPNAQLSLLTKFDFVNISTDKLVALEAALRPLFKKSSSQFWNLSKLMARMHDEIQRRVT